MGTMIIVSLVLAWMLLSTIIIIGVAMATSQGSRRELPAKDPLDSVEPPRRPEIKIGRRRAHATRPRPQWAEGPPRSMKPYRN